MLLHKENKRNPTNTSYNDVCKYTHSHTHAHTEREREREREV